MSNSSVAANFREWATRSRPRFCCKSSRTGLGFIHLNVHSLSTKMDVIGIWAHSTDAEVIVLSETWLNKSVLNKDISIRGFNVYRSD